MEEEIKEETMSEQEEEVKEEAKSEQEEQVKEEKPEPKKQDEEKPLDKMTAKELREVAIEIPGVEGVHAMKKEDLLAIIKEYRGIEDEEPGKKKMVRGKRPALSARELKEKVFRLKEEKEKARGANDRRQVDILRRRINRLKKQSRKAASA